MFETCDKFNLVDWTDFYFFSRFSLFYLIFFLFGLKVIILPFALASATSLSSCKFVSIIVKSLILRKFRMLIFLLVFSGILILLKCKFSNCLELLMKIIPWLDLWCLLYCYRWLPSNWGRRNIFTESLSKVFYYACAIFKYQLFKLLKFVSTRLRP